MNELWIESAKYGGFVVHTPCYDVMTDRRIGRLIVFAGSLADALEFMREQLSKKAGGTDDGAS